MSTPTRIYIVRDLTAPENVEPHLVRATSQSQALRHVATTAYSVKVATQDELVEHVGNGVEVECATATETAHADA
jgi:hypothetical protein